MTIRNLLLGLGAGLTAGYAFARAVEAAAELAKALAAAAERRAAYARIRRALELADTARNVAGTLAFAYGPLARAFDRATGVRAAVASARALRGAALARRALVDLPASFVQDYTLERRFGLSDQSRAAVA